MTESEMNRRIYNILFLLTLCLVWGAGILRAEEDAKSVAIYVSPNGSFENSGASWAEAKDNLQNAIDVLYENPDVRSGEKKGYVLVAGSDYDINNPGVEPTVDSVTYVPTRRSTDDADGSTVNTSFRIYPNINVYGGFKGDEVVPTGDNPDTIYCKAIKDLWKMRWLSTGIRYGELMAKHDNQVLDKSRSWKFKYTSILSGNHHTNNYKFTYDSKRGVYNTVFPLSSYHVVWFGTNGKIDPSNVEDYTPNIEGEDAAGATTPTGGVYYLLDASAKTATVTKKPNGLYTGSITIPATITVGTVDYKVTSIRNGAFAGCTGLTSVTIGNNVTTIGQAAFYGCTNLTSVSLPSSLEDIKRYAFFGCGLTAVNFPSGITRIDRWAFADCAALATATIPSTVSYIGRYAFKNTALPANTVFPNYEAEEESMTGHFRGLPYKARVSGFTIEGGNASSTNLNGHDHTGFGGGAYLVRNSVIEDCIIHHCAAVQRGGGVYLDGGGDVNYCYIHTCQAIGFGMQQGYGGGVCIDYDGQVEHCYIVQCASRIGAGLAICHNPDEYPEESATTLDPTFYEEYKDNEDGEATAYDPFAKATLISNCTSNAEGAGVYLNYGGSLDHLTVVNNECIGPDVIYYGMRHGRTGGIYVKEAGAIYNSVAWGNKCKVNSDIQFAAFKKETDYDITIDHSAFSKGDITDWASVRRNSVINLNDVNYPNATFYSGNFPMFQQPTVVYDNGSPTDVNAAGIQYHSDGTVNPNDTLPGQAYQDAYNWHPLGMSSMRGKGKQIVDVTIATRAELLHANADRDALGIKFESVSVCGAITNSYHSVTFAMMPSLEKIEGRVPGETANIPTLFVDKTKVATSATNTDGKVGYEEDQALGADWTYPLNNLQDAVYFFSQYLVDDPATVNTKEQYAVEGNCYYDFSAFNGDATHYPHVQILVKEGTMNVAGRGAYLTGHIRTAAVRPASNMRLYGGYPGSTSGTTMTGRDPRKYESIVKADVTGGEFNDHSVHVFSIANMHDVVIDGFRLMGGNGNIAPPPAAGETETDEEREEREFYEAVANGGGLAMNNSREDHPRDMTGNILRNCVISNCAAPEGAAIYVNGNKNHCSASRKCKAELTVVNTIIRNCTAGDTWGNPDRFLANNITPILDQITLYGVVTADGQGANIYVRNSDVVNNCGFPFKCNPIATIGNTPGDATYGGRLTREAAASDEEFSNAGHIQVYNSVIFSNGLRVHADRSNIANTVFCPKESWYNVTGEYIYMGYDVLLPKDFVDEQGEAEINDNNLETRLNKKHIYRMLTHNMGEDGKNLYWRINDGSQQGRDSTTYTPAEKDANRVRVRYPYFANPSRNVGHSTTDDKSYYGGAVSYEPLPTNPIVNAANAVDTRDNGMGLISGEGKVCMNYDMALTTRDNGGDPDIGAIETDRLPKAGAALYVTPDGAGRRDGSSWGNAIAGNAVYRVGESYVIDHVNSHGGGELDTISTKNSLYRGGYAVDYVYRKGKDTYVDKQNITTKTIYKTKALDGSIITREGGSTVNAEKTYDYEVDYGTSGSGTLMREKTEYLYGEKSGSSRNFYRTNLKDSQIGSVYMDATVKNGYKGVDIDNALFIANNRVEDYVSGLQFAVEKAAELNKDKAKADRVQVWVGNGVYEDYKGYVMRDKVEVLGGFPVTTYATPGLTERQALVSQYIPLAERNASLKDKEDLYETILQVIDQRPYVSTARDAGNHLFDEANAADYTGKWTFNSAVQLYQDKDYTESGNKTITTTTSVTIPVYYRRDSLPGGGYSEPYEVPGDNVVADFTSRIINPGFEQNCGRGDWTNVKAKHGWPSITGFNLSGDKTSANHGAEIKNNTSIEFYQDIENLEPGLYRISCQGFNKQNAVNNVKLFANGSERVLMTIKTEDATTSALNTAVALLAEGKYNDNWVDVYVGEAGHLRFGLKGTYAGSGWTVFDNFRLEMLSGAVVASSETEEEKIGSYTDKTYSKTYTSFRKHVLFMPDVCLSTYWPGTLSNDNISNERRQNISSSGGVITAITPKIGSGYVKYEEAHWDGFTIRNGFVYDYYANRDGGGGVRMFEGGSLENCVVTDNTVHGAIRTRGGGAYCDGNTSTIIGCFFVDNLNTGIRNATPTNSNDKDNNGGGIYMLVGTCYNSLFANNLCWGKDARGAGIYIEQATFYNNTVAYNTCRNRNKTIYTSKGNGVHQYEGVNGGAVLNVFNTVIYGNTGPAIGAQDVSKINGFKNCYIQSTTATDATIIGKMRSTFYDNAGTKKYVDESGSLTNLSEFLNPFEKGDNAKVENNFRLLGSSRCVNNGIDLAELLDTYPDKDVDFADRVQDCHIDMGAYEYDGTTEIRPTLYPVKKQAIFYVTETGHLKANAQDPDNAACYLKFQKVLDAAGRWRYASYKYAVNNGKTESDENYDYTQAQNNFTEDVLRSELAEVVLAGEIDDELENLKDYEVIVKLEGSDAFDYVPTRSTVNNGGENVLQYSLMVPHGIRVEGGYEDSFAQPRDILGRQTSLDGTVSEEGGRAYHVITFTNNLYTPKEVLFKKGENNLENQLAFLSDVNVIGQYTADNYPWDAKGYDDAKWGELIEGYSGMDDEAKATAVNAKKTEIITQYNLDYPNAWVENQRAVLDGLFIRNGNANGSDEDQQNGAGAVVTDYAHIRNCVVQNNVALGSGGGLYLESHALVSGCIIKNDTAKYGGGLFVYEPENGATRSISTNQDTYAHVISTTISGNEATVSAGGLYFSTNVRANSVAVWSNGANQNPNVAGTDATGMTQLVENYPMNYCGVESRRMAGVNNIELPAAASDGVRWDGSMPYENDGTGQDYFPITLASVLTRSGMTYSAYKDFQSRFPTLEYTDIFGLNRMEQGLKEVPPAEEGDDPTYVNYQLILAGGAKYDKEEKNNNFIEIGARVMNGNFEVKLEFEHIMRRLFVTTTERLPTDKAVILQKNTLADEWDRRYSGVDLPTEESDPEDQALKKEVEDDVEMYKQMGSSFLNPFIRLGDALDYIVRVRKSDNPFNETTVGDYYKDQRFEVYICGGTFYPYRDAYGVQGESRANTFLVPEGVTIIGGINHEADDHNYCQEGHPADTVITPEPGEEIGDPKFRASVEVAGYTLNGATTYDIRMAREHQDRNGNNVNEPWEMEEQTILSGVAVQNDAKANVYHVITCLANEEQIGKLPTRKNAAGEVLSSHGPDISPTNQGYTGTLLTNLEAESQKSRDSRVILIDGVTITGGYANKIDESDITRNAQMMTYFRGGGILVEGNWDSGFDDDYDLPEVLGVAKRDIPLMLTSCLIKDNVAANGGGVYTNGTFYSFSCHYTQNLAIGPVTENDLNFIPWSAGGAIANNYNVHVWNTLFDNNEAQRGIYKIRDKKTTSGGIMCRINDRDVVNPVENADARQGYAGAISCSETGLVRACNCDFVRNKAVAFPAIYNFLDNNLRAISSYLPNDNPHYYGKGWHFAVNSLFWGNEATMPAGTLISPSTGWEMEYYTALYGQQAGHDNRQPYHVANFGPKLDVATLTFCSYEDGTGRDGTVWWSNQDKAKEAPIVPMEYDDYGLLDGLTRLYMGRFTDVLDEYFGYYKEGTPDKPYYVNQDPADATSKYIPSTFDNLNLKYDGSSNGTGKYVYSDGHADGTTIPDAINLTHIRDSLSGNSYLEEMARYQCLMDTLDAVTYNYNLVLNSENTATGGPFFVLPSLSAGVDGYMETANWLVSRLNNTIDTGWGFLKQRVTQKDETTGLFETTLLKTAKDENENVIQSGGNDVLVPIGYYLYTKDITVGNETKTVPDSVANRFKRVKTRKGESTVIGTILYGDPDTVLIPLDKEIILDEGKNLGDEGTYTWMEVSKYTQTENEEEYTYTIYRKAWNYTNKTISSDANEEEQYHDLFGEGFYNLHSKNIHLRYHDLGYPNLLPIGDDTYMTYVHEGETESKNMRRISTHPKMGVQDVYIDMGIYEYQYVQLLTSGSETDVIWVGPEEKGKGNGATCEDATTNLQEAIETLLRSRNDHDKMVKMIGGTYSPQPTTNSQNKAFFIEVPSRTDGITLPKTLNADQTHTVKSLTIRGGYSPDTYSMDDGESTRDPDANPVILEMRRETGNSEQSLAHLFIIEDAEEKGCYMNYLTNTNKEFKDNVMPIVLDGLTFVNPYGEDYEHGGAAIYYKEQYKTVESMVIQNDFREDRDHLLKPVTYSYTSGLTTVHDTIPKLLIKNCVIAASGDNKNVSAVKIEKGGGPSLIVNTVFHSNAGNPLDAVNTKLVNCTFALNGGHLKLTNETEYYDTDNLSDFSTFASGMYNSIIWKDGQALTDKVQWEGVLNPAGNNMKYNAYTQWNTSGGVWYRPTGSTSEDANHNILLDIANKSVILGPNFVDPKEVFADGMTEEQIVAQKRSRNFRINPSARFINKADSATYRRLVPFYPEQSLVKDITVVIAGVSQPSYVFQSVQRLDRPTTIGDYTYYPSYVTGNQLKAVKVASDLTPYADPCPYTWYRVTTETWDESHDPKEAITVVSNTQRYHTEHELAFKPRWDGAGMERGAYECTAALQRVLYVWEGSSSVFDGSSWEHAFKRDELQTAIDVAAVYTTIKGTSERAYVFVNSGVYNKEPIKIRDGVSVYGGIGSDFFDLAEKTLEGEYTDDKVNEYVNLVCATRVPIASQNAHYSEIIGLESDNDETHTMGFLLDGFKLTATGANRPSTVSETPFVIDKDLTVVKNCLITDNVMANNALDLPVVKINNGLLYNSLVYGNKANTIVKIADGSTTAGVLNCTVVADNAGEVAVASGLTGSVVNTITYNEAGPSIGRTDETIDQDAFVNCNTGTDMFAPYLNTANSYTLPDGFDDILAHRPYHYQLHEQSSCINGGLDTTSVMASAIFGLYKDFVNYADVPTVGEVSGLAGDRDPLGNPRLLNSTPSVQKPDIGCFETWCVADARYASNETEFDHTTHYGGHHYPHQGSVLYVMYGGTLVVDKNGVSPRFTNENPLSPGYVLVKEGGSIYGQGNTLGFSYVAAERNFSDKQYALVAMPFDIRYMDETIKAYYYSGETRSTYNYQFLNENSTAWVDAPAVIGANEGWLADMGSKITGTKRFIGWGDNPTTYAYTENSTAKTVTLTQYDHRSLDSGLDFTRAEDMGWNLKGLPYLVAGYRTDDPDGDEDYRMNIPHVFYKDKDDAVDGYLNNGTVTTVQSWESSPTLSPGYGFFTQTAVIGDEEILTFKLPVYGGSTPLYAAARPIVLMRDMDNEGDLLTVNPDEGAPKDISYSLGRDGVKWMMTDAPQLYLLSAAKSRLSLLGAAPTEVDIPLGVRIPEDPRYVDMPRYFTFSLPEPDAFKDYTHVWLIDRALNRVTNLVEANYAAALSAGTENSRFYLRIGGFPFGNDQRREYIVYAYDRRLYIRGLVEGDQIRVYSTTGQLILSTTAKDPEFTAELPQPAGIYAVRVNDFNTKVRNL